MEINKEEAQELADWSKELLLEMALDKLWGPNEIANNFSRKLHRRLDPTLKSHIQILKETIPKMEPKKRMNFFEEEIRHIIHVIKGTYIGIVLSKRGREDNHLCFQLIVRNNESWFISKHSFSTFWLPDFIMVTTEAKEWLEKNAIIKDDLDLGGWSLK